ncbi:MAG TPA: beta-ketoacyl synthase chain length factor [Holophagaceae bacterium]|nr:beta-ketoacyl synthase chain length factor [Holophagaceae bacterium]
MNQSEFSIPLQRAAFWSAEALPLGRLPGFVDTATGTPDLAFIEPLMRRRLSPLGRGMLHCAGRVAAGQGSLRSVFASRHGEPARTMPILADLAEGLETSPTQFSMNVHNAIAGIWSIVRHDRSPSTSLAAGAGTFAWGLLEAFAQHRLHGGPVLYVYGDDRLPEPLVPYEPRQAPLHALALLLGGPEAGWLRVGRDPEAEGAEPEEPQSLHFLRALGGDGEPWVGPGGAWTWGLETP